MLYKLAKSILFQMQPETAHHVIMANLDWITTLGLHKLLTHTPPEDPVEVMGIRFPNTIGLAAGMDKDGERVSAFGALGFGHVEIGTITPVAQPGNPKPRCFRVIPAEGIVNRMGFNNVGCEQVLRNLKSADAFHLRGGVLGINIGKNAVTPIENAVNDFRICLAKSYDRADYIAVNISSPNTKNLRSLQAEAPLRELLGTLRDERNRIIETEGAPYKPIAVKLAPDLENDAILRAVDIIVEYDMDAVIATNTTIDHSSVQGLPHWNETGGLSGRPLMARSTECLKMITEHLKGRLPVIASGGVLSGEDAVVKMQAGASLVQLYSGFVYKGPELVTECVEAIARWRKQQQA